MIDRRAQRDNSISIFRVIAVVCAICVLVYFIFALATGIEPIATVVACALLCIFLCIFIYLTLNPIRCVRSTPKRHSRWPLPCSRTSKAA